MAHYKSGTWNAQCAVCGFNFKAEQLKERWDGVKVCPEDWEPRHVLDFFKPPPPERTVPWSQPQDLEGRVTYEADSAITVAASLTDNVFYTDVNFGLTQVSLPLADHADYCNSSIIVVIHNESEDQYIFVTSGSDTFIGNTNIDAGTIAGVRNIPKDNQWIREF